VKKQLKKSNKDGITLNFYMYIPISIVNEIKKLFSFMFGR